MAEKKEMLEKMRKWIAENPRPPKYDCEHMTGPKAEYVDVEARIEYAGAFIKESSEPEGGTIVILARILDHNIPDDAYGKAEEGIIEHVRKNLEANVPELEEVGFVLYLFDTVAGEDIVP